MAKLTLTFLVELLGARCLTYVDLYIRLLIDLIMNPWFTNLEKLHMD